MCHHCGADLTKSKEDKKIHENENSLELNTQEFIGSRMLCMLKKMEEDGTPCATPMFSPVATLSSCDSSVSSSSKILSACHCLILFWLNLIQLLHMLIVS